MAIGGRGLGGRRGTDKNVAGVNVLFVAAIVPGRRFLGQGYLHHGGDGQHGGYQQQGDGNGFRGVAGHYPIPPGLRLGAACLITL